MSKDKSNKSLNGAGQNRPKVRRRRFKFGKFILYILIGCLLVFTAFPMVAMISRAFMPLEELFIYPPRIFVHSPTLSNFGDLFTSLNSSTVPFTRYVFNSLWVTIVTVFLSVVICSMGAYGMVKHKPIGAAAIFTVVIAALSFSNHVTKIPNYMVVSNLGLINTYAALIVPSIATAYNFFLVKQFCEQLPDSLLEAARIDGAKEFRIFWTIAMPLLKPAWSTLAVFSFVSNWNDSFSPLVYITSDAMKTLPLALQTMAGGAGVVARSGTVGAATLLTTAPTIIVYTIMRGRVMETMTYSGIKS
ncbi:MAG: carbohydrate ABC transporter permease [Lachnospiraceae bacterium]|nr:carbohydrate ABC transporter permease [Lachnospiraceae bacterium]